MNLGQLKLGLARWLTHWARRLERTATVDSTSTARPPRPGPAAGGPPPHWVELVQRHAPELLDDIESRRTGAATMNAGPPKPVDRAPQPVAPALPDRERLPQSPPATVHSAHRDEFRPDHRHDASLAAADDSTRDRAPVPGRDDRERPPTTAGDAATLPETPARATTAEGPAAPTRTPGTGDAAPRRPNSELGIAPSSDSSSAATVAPEARTDAGPAAPLHRQPRRHAGPPLRPARKAAEHDTTRAEQPTGVPVSNAESPFAAPPARAVTTNAADLPPAATGARSGEVPAPITARPNSRVDDPAEQRDATVEARSRRAEDALSEVTREPEPPPLAHAPWQRTADPWPALTPGSASHTDSDRSDRWPSLPETAATDSGLSGDGVASTPRAIERARLRRLGREQQGIPWST